MQRLLVPQRPVPASQSLILCCQHADHASDTSSFARQEWIQPDASGINDGVAAPGTPVAGHYLDHNDHILRLCYSDAVSRASINYAIIPYDTRQSALHYNSDGRRDSVANANHLKSGTAGTSCFIYPVTGGAIKSLNFGQPDTLQRGRPISSAETGFEQSFCDRDRGCCRCTFHPTAGTTLVTTISSTATTSFNDATVSPASSITMPSSVWIHGQTPDV